jgi:F-type H+-transporting ATPase subunit gamma
MANLKDIRTRIQSVGSTMQITNAMKMVSAAKLKKAQDAIEKMRPYAEKLTELLSGLSANLDADLGGDYAAQREVKNVLLVPITSNRGLCGALNTNIIKQTISLIENDYKDKNVALITIGKKAYDALSKKYNVTDNQSQVYDDLNFDNVAKIAQNIMDGFVDKKYDKVVLIYNSFKNAATQIVKSEQFLPIKTETDGSNVVLDYIYEPSQAEIVLELIPKSLKTQFYKAIRDAWASEHGARMTSMHKATDNAKEMKDDLTLQYNKARQAVITGEILEIVSGAEALKNQS